MPKVHFMNKKKGCCTRQFEDIENTFCKLEVQICKTQKKMCALIFEEL